MSKDSPCLNGSVGTCKTQETEYIIGSPKENSLLSCISLTLIDVIYNNHLNENYKNKLKLQKKHNFTSKKIPKISLGDYLKRVFKYTNVENSTLIMALIYIDRFCRNRKIILTEFNVHRIFFSALLIAIKYNEDKYYSNLYYAKIGGLELKKLNKLEADFLVGISFRLFVNEKDYEQYESNICCTLIDSNDQLSFLAKGVLMGN